MSMASKIFDDLKLRRDNRNLRNRLIDDGKIAGGEKSNTKNDRQIEKLFRKQGILNASTGKP